MIVVFVSLITLPLLLIQQKTTKVVAEKSTAKKPLIELVNFTYSEVDTNGANKLVLGSLGYHFADHEQLFDLNFSQKAKGKIQTLNAKTVNKSSDTFYFNGGINADGGDGTLLKTDSANYNESTKQLSITADFIVVSQKYKISGSSGIVSSDGKKIVANKIKAKIQTDK